MGFLDDIKKGSNLQDAGARKLAAKPPPVRMPTVKADLGAPLTAIYKHDGQAWPMDRVHATYRSLMSASNGRMYGRIKMSCTDDMIKRLATVFSFCAKEGVMAEIEDQVFTVEEFMALTPVGQIAVVNALWNKCTTPKTYDKKLGDMTEPDQDVAATVAQLPSSVHPAGKGGVLPYVRGPERTPFKTVGVGFRVDGTAGAGGDISSIDRVKREGLTAQVLNKPFMMNVRHMEVTETAVSLNLAAPRIYTRAQDLFNETAVCVSRSFFGATAFPERTTDGEVAVWAVCCRGLTGFDTEKHQVDNKAKPWRPGEKCYQRIRTSSACPAAPPGATAAHGRCRTRCAATSLHRRRRRRHARRRSACA